MPETPLIEAWRGHLAAGTAGLHLAGAGHPLQVFVGANDAGAARLVIRSDSKPAKPALSDLVFVERYEDGSSKWNLSFVLQDPKFTEVFLRLADDVHARSRTASSETVALNRVDLVFDEWRRLLRPRPSGVLSTDELRGLIGELWLIENRYSTIRTTEEAITGWLGPLGLAQDFWYPEDGYHEAKAVGPSTTHVRIASEYQLDSDNLELVVIHIPSASEQTAGAVNLPTIVTRIRAALESVGASSDDLDLRLDRMGVDLRDPHYQDSWFLIAQVSTYAVGPGFPLIAASALPAGIDRVGYRVELATIEEHLTSREAIS